MIRAQDHTTCLRDKAPQGLLAVSEVVVANGPKVEAKFLVDLDRRRPVRNEVDKTAFLHLVAGAAKHGIRVLRFDLIAIPAKERQWAQPPTVVVPRVIMGVEIVEMNEGDHIQPQSPGLRRIYLFNAEVGCRAGFRSVGQSL